MIKKCLLIMKIMFRVSGRSCVSPFRLWKFCVYIWSNFCSNPRFIRFNVSLIKLSSVFFRFYSTFFQSSTSELHSPSTGIFCLLKWIQYITLPPWMQYITLLPTTHNSRRLLKYASSAHWSVPLFGVRIAPRFHN